MRKHSVIGDNPMELALAGTSKPGLYLLWIDGQRYELDQDDFDALAKDLGMLMHIQQRRIERAREELARMAALANIVKGGEDESLRVPIRRL